MTSGAHCELWNGGANPVYSAQVIARVARYK